MTKPWWINGVNFTCACSGNCCKTNGEFAYVYFTTSEVQKAAKYLDISVREFKRLYITTEDGLMHVKDPKRDCVFLDKGKCSIYPARPQQCATWPFWPENMSSKEQWKKEVLPICKGARNGERGKGELHSAAKIANLLKKQF